MCPELVLGLHRLPHDPMVVDLSVDGQGEGAIFAHDRLSAGIFNSSASSFENALVTHTNADDTQSLMGENWIISFPLLSKWRCYSPVLSATKFPPEYIVRKPLY